MKYKLSNGKKNEVLLEVTLDNKEWNQEVDNAYNKHKHQYHVEGFRKGKVPRKVIENTYGPTVFYEEALSEAFSKCYSQVLSKETTLEPVDMPSLEVKSLDEKGVVILATIPVMPEVVLGAYTGLNISNEPKKVTDKEVLADLKKVQEQNARFVEFDGVSALGHILNIDFAGYIDGKAFDGGTASGYDIELGSHTFIDTFEDQLVGTKAGDKVDVNVTFPSNYQVDELAGKPAVFKVTVNAVKSKELPELNDAFASDVSEFETLDEYKAHIREHLEHHALEDAKIKTENQIIDKIVSGIKVDVPASMVESELNNIMQDLEYRLMYQGLKLEDYAKYLGQSVEEMRESRRKDATKGVKVRLAMQEIIKKEKMDVTKEDVDAKVKEMAKSAKKTIKEYKETLTDERLNYIKNDILMNKLLTFLIENNK